MDYLLFDIDGKLFVDRTLSMIEDYFNLNMEFNMRKEDIVLYTFDFEDEFDKQGYTSEIELNDLIGAINGKFGLKQTQVFFSEEERDREYANHKKMRQYREKPLFKRIWIELDKADSFEEAQENCKLANKALIKLGINEKLFFSVRNTKYEKTYLETTFPVEAIEATSVSRYK
jgi:hypothetical protein